MSQVKVLIVDDEVEFATALSERLRLRNYDTKAAYNPEDAISSVKGDLPDVVLLDLKLPGMDGIELFQIIHKIDPSIEVIMLSGQGDSGNLEEALRIGIFEYLVKPVDINELVLKIEKAQKKRHPEE